MHAEFTRTRRLRRNETIRRMVRETTLSVDDLIMPLFVTWEDKPRPIASMPGQAQLPVGDLVEEVRELEGLGVPGVILFGIPEHKDPEGTDAYDPEGIVQKAVSALKQNTSSIQVITDVCLCEYTDHGHCGLLAGEDVDNDPTIELLARSALSHVEAGADIVAPSDMMDGRVRAIRALLDEHGHTHTPIMAYSAKYASGFYGPFREAAESAPQFGDRRSYQMDPPNSDEAIREIESDLEEGADMVMVKPALAYLDIIRRARDLFPVPLGAYNVSGEYAMIKAAAQQGWIEHDRIMMEVLTSIKRAGADVILTYFAKDVAKILG